jgi:hypothetical protein
MLLLLLGFWQLAKKNCIDDRVSLQALTATIYILILKTPNRLGQSIDLMKKKETLLYLKKPLDTVWMSSF